MVAAIVIATVATLSAFFDQRLASAAATLSPDAVAWGGFVSSLGRSGYMFGIAGALLAGALLARSRSSSPRLHSAASLLAERAAFVLATLAASGIAAQVVKHLVGRARPDDARHFDPYQFGGLSVRNAFASFPSGHTTTAFAMAVALSLLLPRLRVALFTLALAIGCSRIVVQAHYISDVAAGGLLGTLTAWRVAHVFAARGIAFIGSGAGLQGKTRCFVVPSVP